MPTPVVRKLSLLLFALLVVACGEGPETTSDFVDEAPGFYEMTVGVPAAQDTVEARVQLSLWAEGDSVLRGRYDLQKGRDALPVSSSGRIRDIDWSSGRWEFQLGSPAVTGEFGRQRGVTHGQLSINAFGETVQAPATLTYLRPRMAGTFVFDLGYIRTVDDDTIRGRHFGTLRLEDESVERVTVTGRIESFERSGDEPFTRVGSEASVQSHLIISADDSFSVTLPLSRQIRCGGEVAIPDVRPKECIFGDSERQKIDFALARIPEGWGVLDRPFNSRDTLYTVSGTHRVGSGILAGIVTPIEGSGHAYYVPSIPGWAVSDPFGPDVFEVDIDGHVLSEDIAQVEDGQIVISRSDTVFAIDRQNETSLPLAAEGVDPDTLYRLSSGNGRVLLYQDEAVYEIAEDGTATSFPSPVPSTADTTKNDWSVGHVAPVGTDSAVAGLWRVRDGDAEAMYAVFDGADWDTRDFAASSSGHSVGGFMWLGTRTALGNGQMLYSHPRCVGDASLPDCGKEGTVTDILVIGKTGIVDEGTADGYLQDIYRGGNRELYALDRGGDAETIVRLDDDFQAADTILTLKGTRTEYTSIFGTSLSHPEPSISWLEVASDGSAFVQLSNGLLLATELAGNGALNR